MYYRMLFGLGMGKRLNSSYLKIYSLIPGGPFRLTKGYREKRTGLAIIADRHYRLDGDHFEALRALLRVLRPLPEIVVIGNDKRHPRQWDRIKDEFGCAVEVSENKTTSATTFNALIDDGRRVIFII